MRLKIEKLKCGCNLVIHLKTGGGECAKTKTDLKRYSDAWYPKIKFTGLLNIFFGLDNNTNDSHLHHYFSNPTFTIFFHTCSHTLRKHINISYAPINHIHSTLPYYYLQSNIQSTASLFRYPLHCHALSQTPYMYSYFFRSHISLKCLHCFIYKFSFLFPMSFLSGTILFDELLYALCLLVLQPLVFRLLPSSTILLSNSLLELSRLRLLLLLLFSLTESFFFIFEPL